MIRKGQTVVFKSEWQDLGDAEITFVAIEDENDGRVTVRAEIGLTFNPVQAVTVAMIQCAS